MPETFNLTASRAAFCKLPAEQFSDGRIQTPEKALRFLALALVRAAFNSGDGAVSIVLDGDLISISSRTMAQCGGQS